MQSNAISRRQALVRTVASAAGLGLSMTILAASRKAQAKVDPTPNPTSDVQGLNGLLKAEYDAIATYTAGAGIIGKDSGTPQATRDIVTKVAVHFQDQHKEHAAALKSLITSTGGTPVADSGTAKIPASFPAAATTTDVIKLAADKEKQAAFAYAQTVAGLSTQAAAKLAAAIGGVETQHFVVLYLLAEGLIQATSGTGTNAALVVPASFVLNVGASGTTNLESFPALDTLLKLDPKS